MWSRLPHFLGDQELVKRQRTFVNADLPLNPRLGSTAAPLREPTGEHFALLANLALAGNTEGLFGLSTGKSIQNEGRCFDQSK